MKPLAVLLLLVLAVAATAYGVTRYLGSRQTEDQWTWLRREFRLSDAQFARVRALHEAYQPVCADHCARIMAAHERLTRLEQSGARTSPAYAAALAEWQALCRECNQATLQHLEKVAREMDPDAGRRYLDLMLPRVAQGEHRGPPEVR